MGVISLEEHRLRGDANTYRRLLAAAILKKFRQENGNGPRTIDDYIKWRATIDAEHTDPFEVLTAKEVEQLVNEK